MRALAIIMMLSGCSPNLCFIGNPHQIVAAYIGDCDASD